MATSDGTQNHVCTEHSSKDTPYFKHGTAEARDASSLTLPTIAMRHPLLQLSKSIFIVLSSPSHAAEKTGESSSAQEARRFL